MACKVFNNCRTDRQGVSFWTGYIDDKCTTGVGISRGGGCSGARADFLRKYGKKPGTLPSLDAVRNAVANPVAGGTNPVLKALQPVTDPIRNAFLPSRSPPGASYNPQCNDPFYRLFGKFPFTNFECQGTGFGQSPLQQYTGPQDQIRNAINQGLNPSTIPGLPKSPVSNKCATGDYTACATEWIAANPLLAAGAVGGLLLLLLLLSRR